MTNDVYEGIVEDVGERLYRWSGNTGAEVDWVNAVRRIWSPRCVAALDMSEFEAKVLILKTHMHQLPRGDDL